MLSIHFLRPEVGGEAAWRQAAVSQAWQLGAPLWSGLYENAICDKAGTTFRGVHLAPRARTIPCALRMGKSSSRLMLVNIWFSAPHGPASQYPDPSGCSPLEAWPNLLPEAGVCFLHRENDVFSALCVFGACKVVIIKLSFF